MSRQIRRAAVRVQVEADKYEAELARRAVQEALDRRDNGGDTGR
jgi:hypothetical protein